MQVILNVYETPRALLLDFDVDVCCVAYIPSERKVVCTPRGRRAIRYSTNIADSDYDGPNYHRRLLKYDARGFTVAVPGFEAKRLSRTFTEGRYVMLEPYDVLLRAQADTVEEMTRADSFERASCSSVRGFELLCAHKYANIERVSCDNGRVRAAVTRDKLALFYGLDDVDDETYSPSPVTAVHEL